MAAKVVQHIERKCALVSKCDNTGGKRGSMKQNVHWNWHLIANGMWIRDVDRLLCIHERIVELDNKWRAVVHRKVPPTMHYHGKPLRGRQFLLELAVASNIHDAQGMTLQNPATYLDSDFRHPMWSWVTAFTLLNRAQTLRRICLVDYDASERYHVLQHQTAWHAPVEVWPRQSQFTQGIARGIWNSRWTRPSPRRIPPLCTRLEPMRCMSFNVQAKSCFIWVAHQTWQGDCDTAIAGAAHALLVVGNVLLYSAVLR